MTDLQFAWLEHIAVILVFGRVMLYVTSAILTWRGVTVPVRLRRFARYRWQPYAFALPFIIQGLRWDSDPAFFLAVLCLTLSAWITHASLDHLSRSMEPTGKFDRPARS